MNHRRKRISRRVGNGGNGDSLIFADTKIGTVPDTKIGSVPVLHRGVTLVEVLLVLAIVAVTSALAWPSLREFLASRSLHSAADEVRTEWCRARVEAMQSGRTHSFRFELGGDRYRTEPQESPRTVSTSAVAASVDSASGPSESRSLSGSAPSPSTPASPNDKTLPSGIRFVSIETGDGALTSPPAAVQMSSEDDLAMGWSDPILFYPDGTASDVLLVLAFSDNHAVRVMLRGITGSVTIADAASTTE